MKSLHLLYEYGISESIIKTLIENNISIENIYKNKVDLLQIPGISKTKVLNINNAVYQIMHLDRDNSVYDLCKYGLSFNLAESLFIHNVDINNLINDINSINLPLGSKNKVLKAYDNFRCSDKLSKEKTLELIYNKFKGDSFTIKELKEALKIYDVSKCGEILNSLYFDGLLVFKGHINLPTLEAKINEIENIKQKEILIAKLNGNTLEAIGNIYFLTRERVRQIVKNLINKLGLVKEELMYKSYFIKYNISSDLFIKLFNSNILVYNFLKEKYELGKTSPSLLLKEDDITPFIEDTLLKEFNLIKINSNYITNNDLNIIIYILKEANTSLGIEEILDKCNKLKEDLNIPKTDLNERNIMALLERNNKVIHGFGRSYRYFELDKVNKEELLSILNNAFGDYSTLYFYEHNSNLMNKYDIRDEYELHNILKRIYDDENIVFTRMPDVLIGYNDKFDFIKILILKLAPINVDDFIKHVRLNYGHKENTFSTYLKENFSNYIHDDVLTYEFVDLLKDEDYKILKDNFINDIYSLNEVKELFIKSINKFDPTYINNYVLNKIGYKLRSNYIIKNEIKSIVEYLGNIILKDDYFIDNGQFNYLKTSYTSFLYDLLKNKEIFKYENNKYITLKGLRNFNISKNDILNYLKDISNNLIDDKFYTYQTLNINKLNLELPDSFYENLLLYIDDIKHLRFSKFIIFKKTDKQFNINDVLDYFINRFDNINEIKKTLLNELNIDINVNLLIEYLHKYNYEIDLLGYINKMNVLAY